MKQFNIIKGSTLPYLEIEPIADGRNTYKKLYEAIQGADVTFTMTNIDSGIKKIANAKAYVMPKDTDGCEERFKIQYRWNKRDTSESGRFLAQFKIKFSEDIVNGDTVYPKGELIVPISEQIVVDISDCGIA